MKNRLVILAAMLVGVASLAVTAQAAPTGQTASGKTVVTVAAGDKRFTTLVALVKQAGLVTTLNGKGPFTVFAPTNAAFAKLKAQAPDTFTAVSTDKALLDEGAHLPRAREARARAPRRSPPRSRARR